MIKFNLYSIKHFSKMQHKKKYHWILIFIFIIKSVSWLCWSDLGFYSDVMSMHWDSGFWLVRLFKYWPLIVWFWRIPHLKILLLGISWRRLKILNHYILRLDSVQQFFGEPLEFFCVRWDGLQNIVFIIMLFVKFEEIKGS